MSRPPGRSVELRWATVLTHPRTVGRIETPWAGGEPPREYPQPADILGVISVAPVERRKPVLEVVEALEARFRRRHFTNNAKHLVVAPGATMAAADSEPLGLLAWPLVGEETRTSASGLAWFSIAGSEARPEAPGPRLPRADTVPGAATRLSGDAPSARHPVAVPLVPMVTQ